MDEIRRIMGESAQTHHTLRPPMKHVLCRTNSLAEVITKTREVLVSTDLRHSLIREEIRKLENVRKG
jgi:hypothetical protein